MAVPSYYTFTVHSRCLQKILGPVKACFQKCSIRDLMQASCQMLREPAVEIYSPTVLLDRIYQSADGGVNDKSLEGSHHI